MLNKSYYNLCKTGVHLANGQKFSGAIFQGNSDLLKNKTTITFVRKVHPKCAFKKSPKSPLLLHLSNEQLHFCLKQFLLKRLKYIFGAAVSKILKKIILKTNNQTNQPIPNIY